VFHHVRIEKLVAQQAPVRVTSAALEDELAPAYQRLGIPPKCIETLTGIVARRFWPEGPALVEHATAAARQCLEESGVPREKVGLLVSCSVSKEQLEPSIAAMVHGDLGLSPTAPNFDLSNACLGFLTSMELAARQIEARHIDYALVVSAESSRRVVDNTVRRLLAPSATMDDYKAYLPTLTLGSGAVAMLLCHEDVATSGHTLHGVVSRAATEHSRICIGSYDEMRTDATTLLKEGVALGHRTWKVAGETFGWSDASIDAYVMHQVGGAHLGAITKELGLTLDKAFPTYGEFGNMGSTAMPFTLRLAADAGKVSAGSTVALMGIGSGLNVSMGHVTW
jgi:3-oxoacyl-[acyl-carrier-protein] synthase-3